MDVQIENYDHNTSRRVRKFPNRQYFWSPGASHMLYTTSLICVHITTCMSGGFNTLLLFGSRDDARGHVFDVPAHRPYIMDR